MENKKVEALSRMVRFGIFPDTIKHFQEDNKVSICEPPFGAFYWAEGEDLERIRLFEKEHDALVYLVIRSYTSIGKMDSYLFVSKYRDEWQVERDAICGSDTSVVPAYVYNHDDPDCSEMGYIGVQPTVGAGLERVW